MPDMNANQLDKNTLDVRIDERKLSNYKLESALLDMKYNTDDFSKGYKRCLRDEIKENKDYIKEYKDQLKALK